MDIRRYIEDNYVEKFIYLNKKVPNVLNENSSHNARASRLLWLRQTRTQLAFVSTRDTTAFDFSIANFDREHDRTSSYDGIQQRSD